MVVVVEVVVVVVLVVVAVVLIVVILVGVLLNLFLTNLVFAKANPALYSKVVCRHRNVCLGEPPNMQTSRNL